MFGYNYKYKYIYFFKDRRIQDTADLVATRLEESERYYIHKCKGGELRSGDIVTKDEFMKVLVLATRPIVLSDSYIDLEL